MALVEVPLLLSFFGFLLVDSILGNLVIFRTCYVTLGYDKEQCAKLGSSSDPATAALEKLVQPDAAVIGTARGVLEGVVGAVMCLLIGPWSDKFGRKPVLITCFVGFLLNDLCLAVYASIDSLSAWYLFVTSVPYMFVGGLTSYLAVILSYITDTTSDAARGLRMSIFEAVIAVGMLLGTITSSHLFYLMGYTYTFLLAGGCMLTGLIYIVFFVPESLQNIETSQGKLRGFFDVSNIKTMLKAPLQPREGNNRSIIIIMIVFQSILMFCITGNMSIFTLYLREKFHFTLEEYTTFNCISNVIWILGASFGVIVFYKLLRIPESVIILCGCISMVNGMLLYGLAQDRATLYGGAVAKFIGALLGPMIRSLISKRVHRDEVGKIFSFMMISQGIISLGAGPLYTAVYDATIDTNPATILFVEAGLHTINGILILAVLLLQNMWRCSKYTPLLQEDGQTIVEDELPNNVLANSVIVGTIDHNVSL